MKDWSKRVMNSTLETQTSRNTLVAGARSAQSLSGVSVGLLALPNLERMDPKQSRRHFKHQFLTMMDSLGAEGPSKAHTSTQLSRHVDLIPGDKLMEQVTRLAIEEEMKAMYEEKQETYTAKGGRVVMYTPYGQFPPTSNASSA